MLSRTTTLAALGIAALISGGTTAGTVLTQTVGNETGVATSAPHKADAAAHRSDATSASTNETSAPELPPCPTDVKNHGEYVSSVAKSAHDASDDTNHGALVSAAAQSDCGKPAGAEADASESSDTNDESAEADGKSAEEHGKAGKQHGKSGEHIPGQAPAGS